MFPSRTGKPLEVLTIARQFQALLRRAGLPRFELYDLRHTYASQLLAENAPITYVAAQLGHAKPATTLQYYAHWLPRGDKAYIDQGSAHVQYSSDARYLVGDWPTTLRNVLLKLDTSLRPTAYATSLTLKYGLRSNSSARLTRRR